MLCLASVIFAFNSYGLVMVTMANIGFLEQYGLMAVMHGSLWQLLWLGLKGGVSLLAYLVFKGVETELVQRWRGYDGAPD